MVCRWHGPTKPNIKTDHDEALPTFDRGLADGQNLINWLKKKEDPGALIPTMSAGEVNDNGELLVRNETSGPYRLYYRKDLAGAAEILWRMAQGGAQQRIELPSMV